MPGKSEDLTVEMVKKLIAESKAPIDPIDDTREKVNSFMARVAAAKLAGKESIEASDEIINHFNRKGLNGGKYFIYDSVKVYPKGKTEEIEKEESTSSYVKLHGTGDGIAEYGARSKVVADNEFIGFGTGA